MTVTVLHDINLFRGDVLSQYWQKSPVALLNAVDVSKLVPDTNSLVAIITQTDLPSKIITGNEDEQLRLISGPFKTFQKPASPWTVLIHAVENLFPEYDTFRRQITWLPMWRFEDCMLSWANKGGSVGRHYDQFSVFLVQLSGRKHWELGPKATEDTQSSSNKHLNLVASSFENWQGVFEPGDALYLPPNTIHKGKAIDDNCVTLSIGFRAPDAISLLEAALESPLADKTNLRFEDKGRSEPDAPAKISAADQKRAKKAILAYLDQPGVLADILGIQVTIPYLDSTQRALSDQELEQIMISTSSWELDPNCRMVYSDTTLYINGERIGDKIPNELLELADTRRFSQRSICSLNENWFEVVQDLIRQQWLIPFDDPN